MCHTEYVSKLSDKRIVRMVCLCSGIYPCEIESAQVNRGKHMFGVTIKQITMLDGETEPSYLSDYFELDDFTLTPYDYAGDRDESRRWRTWMYQIFQKEYAIACMLAR